MKSSSGDKNEKLSYMTNPLGPNDVYAGKCSLINGSMTALRSPGKRNGTRVLSKLRKGHPTMRAAILAFGAEQQLRMLQEECVELAHAISKHLRDKEDCERRGHVSDEIADVLITIEQAMLILNSKPYVQNEIERKLKRLKTTVKEFNRAKKTP